MIEYSNDMVAVVGLDGIVLYRSPSSTELLGFSDGDMEANARASGIDGYFLKPVLPEELASHIRRMVAQISGPTNYSAWLGICGAQG